MVNGGEDPGRADYIYIFMEPGGSWTQ